jgi:hypothetical protein
MQACTSVSQYMSDYKLRMYQDHFIVLACFHDTFNGKIEKSVTLMNADKVGEQDILFDTLL